MLLLHSSSIENSRNRTNLYDKMSLNVRTKTFLFAGCLCLLIYFLFLRSTSRAVEPREPKDPPTVYFNPHKAVPTTRKRPPTNQLGKEIKLFDPNSIPDDPSITCVPLASAVHKEKICTYPSDKDNYISKVLNDGHVWESDIVEIFKRILSQSENKDMGVIELGTNLGVYAVTAASMGHPVVGCEPYPPNLVRLAKTLRINPHLAPNIKVLPNATADRYETMVFWAQDNNVHPGGTKARSLDHNNYDPQHHKVASMSAETVRTDDLLNFITFKRAILKADIEGGEYRALNSAFNIFDQIDVTHVFMEWNKKYEIAIERHFFIEFFKSRGYTVHRADGDLPQLELSEKASWQWPFDVVFVKQY